MFIFWEPDIFMKLTPTFGNKIFTQVNFLKSTYILKIKVNKMLCCEDTPTALSYTLSSICNAHHDKKS